MFAASFITSTLTVRVHRQARQSALKAYRTEVLLETSQQLQQGDTQAELARKMGRQILRLLDRTVCVYLAGKEGLGPPAVFTVQGAAPDVSPYTAADEQAVAAWVYRNNKHAGATTDTLPGSKCL